MPDPGLPYSPLPQSSNLWVAHLASIAPPLSSLRPKRRLSTAPPHIPLPQSSNLVVRLLDGVCFPALSVLRQRDQFMAYWYALTDEADKAMGAAAAVVAESGVDSPAAVQAAVTAVQRRQAAAAAASFAVTMWGQCEKCILAARLQAASGGGSASREAAFELLLDLVTHDSGCWQKASELLQTQVHEAARSLLAQPYNNSPLQVVRAPR